MDSVIRGSKTLTGADVSEGRLWTYSVSIEDSLVEAVKGNKFNANTGIINLTTASASAVAYFKNTGITPIIISSIGYLMGNASDGANPINDDVEMLVVKKPTAGTIISTATAGDANANRNAGKSDVVSVDFYKGAEGLTLTGGVSLFPSLVKSPQTYVIANAETIISTGESIGVIFTPPTGNTSMNIMVFINYDIQDLSKKADI